MARNQELKNASDVFELFPHLPIELREMILGLAFSLFGSSVTIYVGNPNTSFSEQAGWNRISEAYREVPALLSVSREFRRLAEKYYQHGFKTDRSWDGARWPDWCPHEKKSARTNRELWWDPNLDIVTLHGFKHHMLGNRMPRCRPWARCENRVTRGRTTFDERIRKLSMPYDIWQISRSKLWLCEFPGLQELELVLDRDVGEEYFAGSYSRGEETLEEHRLALAHKALEELEMASHLSSSRDHPCEFLRRVHVVVLSSVQDGVVPVEGSNMSNEEVRCRVHR